MTLKEWFGKQNLQCAGIANGETYVTLRGAKKLLTAFVNGKIDYKIRGKVYRVIVADELGMRVVVEVSGI